ncbi:MAG: Hsp20/alpha crystallin family protein [Acidobacteria bacterium]|nr:Hsp20/alpha crystallin family protein [Acidobacteriota bacterium]
MKEAIKAETPAKAAEHVAAKAPVKHPEPAKTEVHLKPVEKESELNWANPVTMMRNWMDEMERTMAEYGLMNRLMPTMFAADLFRPAFKMFREMPLWNELAEVATQWSPPAEMTRRDDELLVRLDLPGVKKEDVKVEIDHHRLIIHGERKHDLEEKKEGFYRSERTYGAFHRVIPLPDGAKADNAEAFFNNGVLEVRIDMPKIKGAARRLEIKEAK